MEGSRSTGRQMDRSHGPCILMYVRPILRIAGDKKSRKMDRKRNGGSKSNPPLPPHVDVPRNSAHAMPCKAIDSRTVAIEQQAATAPRYMPVRHWPGKASNRGSISHSIASPRTRPARPVATPVRPIIHAAPAGPLRATRRKRPICRASARPYARRAARDRRPANHAKVVARTVPAGKNKGGERGVDLCAARSHGARGRRRRTRSVAGASGAGISRGSGAGHLFLLSPVGLMCLLHLCVLVVVSSACACVIG